MPIKLEFADDETSERKVETIYLDRVVEVEKIIEVPIERIIEVYIDKNWKETAEKETQTSDSRTFLTETKRFVVETGIEVEK